MEKIELTKGHLEMARGASREPSRYAINGLHLSLSGLAETTDGKMLIRLDGVKNPPEAGMIFEPAGIAELNKIIKKPAKYAETLPTASITKEGDSSIAVHKLGENRSTCTLEKIEGTFPKTGEVIPSDATKVFRVDAVRLRLLLDVMIKANTANGNNVNLSNHLPVEFSVNVQPDQYGTRPVLIDFEVAADTEYDGKKFKGQAVLMPLAERK